MKNKDSIVIVVQNKVMELRVEIKTDMEGFLLVLDSNIICIANWKCWQKESYENIST